MKLYQQIANCMQALENCRKSGNEKWEDYWEDCLREIERKYLPSGSGFDTGTVIEERIYDGTYTLITSFHAMNPGGFYSGWLALEITVSPSLLFGFEIEAAEMTDFTTDDIDTEDTVDYVLEVLHGCLDAEVEI